MHHNLHLRRVAGGVNVAFKAQSRELNDLIGRQRATYVSYGDDFLDVQSHPTTDILSLYYSIPVECSRAMGIATHGKTWNAW